MRSSPFRAAARSRSPSNPELPSVTAPPTPSSRALGPPRRGSPLHALAELSRGVEADLCRRLEVHEPPGREDPRPRLQKQSASAGLSLLAPSSPRASLGVRYVAGWR